MKILLDLQGCQTAGSRNRGIGRYSMALARAMMREGPQHEFHILLNGAFADTIEPIRAELADLLSSEHVHVFHPPAGCADNETEQGWRARAAPAIRRCAVRQVQPDVLHVSSLFEGLGDDCTTEIDPVLDGVPAAVTTYDFIPYLYADRYLQQPTVRAWYMRRLDSLGRAALLLGISASACAEAEAVVPHRLGQVVNISSAGNAHLFFPAPPGDAAARLGLTRKFVMYTGGIDWRKNIEGLIAAFSALPRPLRDAYQLAVVCHADAPARARLLDHARQCGLKHDDVVLTGFVPDQTLADLYRSCELFVFPSLHEGFGLPALEAMMCGAAVIGSNASSIPEVIGREDALFDPRSPESIASLMRRALEDSKFRTSLKMHAVAQAARFSWEHTARTALQALERLREQSHGTNGPASVRARPRLAMVAPLPPIESGIADYTCELVAALDEHYEIELVHNQTDVQLPEGLQHIPVRDATWFKRNAGDYDRVVYHFGNSEYHAHMFGLLRQHRGTVVLHDFHLGGVLNWMEGLSITPGAFRHALLRSHGRQALEIDRANGREEAALRFPVNRLVTERANGVIVHSRYSIDAAEQWYGEGYARNWARIPLLRTLPSEMDKEDARRELGLGSDDFLVCSFGHLVPTKLNDRLLEAWYASSLSRDSRCRLILVGKNADPSYSERVLHLVDRAQPGQVTITGYAPRTVYEHYLRAADLAVQLRTMSRGETSGAVLDCLGYGVPLIANANGSNAEYPHDIVHLLSDLFTDEELVTALERLRHDASERSRLSAAAQSYVAKLHDPVAVARQYRNAIESFAARPQHEAYWNAVDALGALGPTVEDNLVAAAIALEATWSRRPS